MSSILIVEDRESLRTMLRETLEAAGHTVDEAEDAAVAIEKVRSRRYLLVLSDLKLPRGDGHGVLKAAREADPDVPVLVMTAYGTVEDAVAAMKAGAFDFLSKPVDTEHLLLLVERALERRRLYHENTVLRHEFADRLGFPRIIGESPALGEVGQQVQRAAASDATVLLQGESGTGKELFARAVHHLSPRKSGPFIAINCAAIPDTLLENELFGHEKGAYTGAVSAKSGRVEMADHGTLFLDEIGDVAPSVQAKLLRVLQEHAFERVGGTRTIEVDIRVVAATNQDLRRRVAEKRFREDLFFRLSVVPITVPPLRDRTEDIPLLVESFLERFRRELARPGLSVAPEALEAMADYAWPGNVRELENCIERAAIVSDDGVIRTKDLALTGRPVPGRELDELRGPLSSGTLAESLARIAPLAERMRIDAAVQRHAGDLPAAAAELGLALDVLRARLKTFAAR
jgi:DNA-binding NtrC family response regulator